jgi:hypothetical protein
MITFIEVIAGNDEGLKFRAEAGIQLGRSRGQIILSDPKISGRHAEIQIDAKGQLILVDLDSSNGILINGQNVKKIALLPGVVFEIGRTQLKVVQMNEDDAEALGAIVTWRAAIKDDVLKMPGENKQLAEVPAALSPFLKLTFIQGLQTDQVFPIGYVPRTAGTHSLDLELLDPEAPENAFRIVQGPGQAMIESLAPTRVFLNKKLFVKAPLNEGDQISFGQSVLKVNYL